VVEVRRTAVQSQPEQDPTPSQKIGLVEWLKVKALSSSPSTTNKTKQKTATLHFRRMKSRLGEVNVKHTRGLKGCG
jgi:hypothetical protein